MQASSGIAGINPADLPSPPAAVARVVRLASDPDVTSEKLGAVIAGDPAFTAELLRTVNSPFYGLKLPVSAASRAVTVLGIRALRNLAICFAVRDSLRNSAFRAQDLELFWEDCLRRAVAARVLARTTGSVPPEEAFTVGLLQDFGMLAILRANRHDFAQWPLWRTMAPSDRHEDEMDRFGLAHDGVAEMLGARWGLPAPLVNALTWHHRPDDPACPRDVRVMAKLAWHADQICALIAAPTADVLAEVREGLAADYNLHDADADRVLECIPLEVEQAATALGMRVARQPNFASIVEQASKVLVEINSSYEELTARLERTLSEKEALMARLEEANAALARLAYYDPLTGLSNRRHYDGIIRDFLAKAAANSTAVSLVMVDLDKFKNVNDTYGHGIGDIVLRNSANAISQCCHDGDIKARLGGEELAVILPGCDAQQAYAAAERFRKAIESCQVTTQQGALKVTASFGVSSFQGSGARVDVERLVNVLRDIGDKALYQSKHNGRNRTTIGGVIR
jgi:two-component system, cell cycle response regulator